MKVIKDYSGVILFFLSIMVVGLLISNNVKSINEQQRLDIKEVR